MFGLGAWEIGLILLVALIFIGPKKLPEVASQLGKGMRDLQRAANDFKREITYPTDPPRYDPARDPYRDLAKKDHDEDDPSLSQPDGEDDEAGGYPDLVQKDTPKVEERNAPPRTSTLREGERPPAPAANVAEGEPEGETEARPDLPRVRPAEGAVDHGAEVAEDSPESTTAKG